MIIPKLLAGGLIGLYFVSILGTLFGLLTLSKIIKNHTKLVPPNSDTATTESE